MRDILVATYTREDTYNGHSKINHYHIPTEIRCYLCDCTSERNMGIMVNGELCPDSYDIVEYNYKGEVTYRHHFIDRGKANACFMEITKKIGGFKKA